MASKLLLPVASFSVPGTPPGAALVALPKRPLASCRCLKEVGVLPLANLEKIRRSGWQVWPKDDRSGESTYFSRAENDVGGVCFPRGAALAARSERLILSRRRDHDIDVLPLFVLVETPASDAPY